MLSEEFKAISLDGIGKFGAAVKELFQGELEKVLMNIMDVNTKAEKPRKITVEISILPDETREKGKVGIEVKSKLIAPKPFSTSIHMGMMGNEFGAVEEQTGEQPLPFNQQRANNVHELKVKEA
jgi:hypothetical protein